MSLQRCNRQNLLTYGYVKQNCIHKFPTVLMDLCLLYYDSILYLNFEDNALNELLSIKKKEFIEIRPFKITNVSFVCGFLSDMNGYIRFYVRLPFGIPYNTAKIDIDTEFYCKQINHLETQSTSIPSNSPQTNLYKNLVWYSERISLNYLAILKSLDEQKLCFSCYVNASKIEYLSDEEINKFRITIKYLACRKFVKQKLMKNGRYVLLRNSLRYLIDKYGEQYECLLNITDNVFNLVLKDICWVIHKDKYCLKEINDLEKYNIHRKMIVNWFNDNETNSITTNIVQQQWIELNKQPDNVMLDKIMNTLARNDGSNAWVLLNGIHRRDVHARNIFGRMFMNLDISHHLRPSCRDNCFCFY
eukprot:452540_1